MMHFKNRVWAEINLDAIRENIETIKSIAKDSRLIAIIKADGYGHGAVEVGRYLESLGIDFFGVSSSREAMELRIGGIKGNILILGYTHPEEAELLADNNISQAVFSKEYALSLSEYLNKCNKKLNVHIKLNTGMNRIGFDCQGENSFEDIAEALSQDSLIFEGLFTHFAAADKDGDPDDIFTNTQYSRFLNCANKLEKLGFNPKIKHCCNSAATLLQTDKHLDAVRTGIIIYGFTPSKNLELPCKLNPAMAFKTVVSMVHTLKKGEGVSYGLTFFAEKNMKVATVAVGYADGYPRFMSRKGEVLIDGKRCKILGNVCMDQMIVDVSHIDNVNIGDEVVLFGEQKENFISAEEIATIGNTINYEIICGISRRVPRYYIGNGKKITVNDYLIKEN